ncbi:MAG: hypothetical protein SH819_13220 [Cytophagales bacterium]|nr:hypothetical protein [Cytophagales bacterium]
MNYKPDEATLVAYHFGELEGEELKKVEAYLQEHPAERKRSEEWRQVRSVMAGLADKEVIAPPLIVGNNERPIWREHYFRMTLGIAASFLVLLVAARLLGLSASISNQELRISFGAPTALEQVLDKAGVTQMIQASLEENNASMQTAWDSRNQKLEASIQKNLAGNSSRINSLVKEASAGQQEQVRQFVGQMQTENLKLMRDYLQLSTTGQKEYLEGLLSDFSRYVQDQRKQDMQYFQANLVNMKENTDQFKKDTEEILTSLMASNRGSRTDNQKSY